MGFTYIPGRDRGAEIRSMGDSLGSLAATGINSHRKYKEQKALEDLAKEKIASEETGETNMMAVDTESTAGSKTSLPPVGAIKAQKPLVAPVEGVAPVVYTPTGPRPQAQPAATADYQQYLDYMKNPVQQPFLQGFQ